MKDPVQYAQDTLIKTIDEIGNIRKDVASISNTINNLKGLIIEYFSDNLQNDETPMGAMRRNQIRKELLDFAQS